eukprot:TRINITY_DN9300_c0_g1_i1.p3 TRINITY_DN9300_c0_g1~~TRINITY_DN9300_c0_g1_i1.p3  ORF type:complete len:160 (-),score=13.90 TRINITY_DN9300_c0_g1_i1:275-754(-)
MSLTLSASAIQRSKFVVGQNVIAHPRSALAKRVSRAVCSCKAEKQGTFTAGPVKALPVTKDNWEKEVIQSEIPVVVDFWAPWCGPCRMISPIMDELHDEYNGKVKIVQINTDESPQIASDLGIRSIPTVIVFYNGEKKDTVIGAVPKTNLTELIGKYLQ